MNKEAEEANTCFTRTSWGKYLMLAALGYVSLEEGTSITAIGTALVDLEIIFRIDMKYVSGYFLAQGLSSALASLLAPLLIRNCNVFMVLAISRLMHGAALFMVVATPYIAVTVVSILAIGFASALTTNVAVYVCNLIVPHDAYALHFLTMSLALGTFLSPLIAEPFLAKNMSEPFTLMGVPNQMFWSNISSNDQLPHASTSVVYFFFILAAMTLPSALAFGIYFLRSTCNQDLQEPSSRQELEYGDMDAKNSWSKLCFLFLIAIMFMTTSGLPFVHGNLILTIAEEGHLKVSVPRASRMTSVYWLMAFFGRLFSVSSSFITKQVVIMYISNIGSVISFTILTLSFYQSSEIWFWIGSLTGGFFSAPGFPAILAWSREYRSLTAFLLGGLLIAGYTGNSVLSFIAGQLISRYGETVQGYYTTGIALFQLTTFCLAHFIATFSKD